MNGIGWFIAGLVTAGVAAFVAFCWWISTWRWFG